MKIIKDIQYYADSHSRHTLDLYLPDVESFPVFIYFHGGGITDGTKEMAESFAGFLTGHGIAVASANYRIYPTAAFPEFLRDAAGACSWVYNHISEYGNCTDFYVGGSSAGGYISMMLCFDKKYLAPYKLSPTDFSGFIHDAGQPTCHFNVLREMGIDSRRVIVNEASPLFYVGIDPEYPPMLFIVSDTDMENRFEQTQLMLSTIKHFEYDMTKINYKLMHGGHCAYINEFDENGDNIFGKIIHEYIKA